MLKALKEAQLQPADIDYINAHATSTFLGDVSEAVAIDKVFNGNKKLLISATKSMTGHLLGATGAVEAIVCILALKNGVIPPTINTKNLDDGIPGSLNIVLNESVQKNIQYAMNNTFGFGGHTATSLFKKFEE
jgi:3-oxoacyl-[acyl-carrier-protein] synthase II